MTRTTRQPVLSKTGCREFGRNSSMTAAEINASALDRNRFGVSLPLILGSLVYLKVILSGGAVVHDADPYWHIATGHWILAHAAIPKQDVFSYTMEGAPWISPEWFAEIIMALAYDTLGWA